MLARISRWTLATALVVPLVALAAPAASADTPSAAPTVGSVGICFSIPLPGSASLFWCF